MSGSKTEMKPLHTEYPERNKVKVAYAKPPSGNDFLRTLCTYISLLCAAYPTACAALLFISIGLVLFGLGEAIFNPRIKYGYVAHDYSNLKSIHDFRMANIDHWCLRGDSTSCRCEDPFQPVSRAEYNSWKVGFKTNRKIVQALEADPSSDIDIAFVGESIVEEMDGRWMGVEREGELKHLKSIFDERFNKKKGGKLSGVALGIAGDATPNVLFRLMNGEMSQKLHPKIYWLTLGMNDLSRMQCSEEVTVLGILRVVEEIINNTNSYVVINSLFPMAMMRGSAYPLLSDATEAFHMKIPNTRRYRKSVLAAPQVKQERVHIGGRRLVWRGATDEQLEEQAQKEEEAREEMVKERHQALRKRIRDRRHYRDPRLKERHYVRKHTNTGNLPIWTSVQEVNRQLRKFAKNNEDRIWFFDVTRLFVTRADTKNVALRFDRITPKGHLTEAGFKAWEDAVVEKALELVSQWKEEHPYNAYNPVSDSEDSFDIDKILDDVQEMEDDLNDDLLFKNTDDMWMERVGTDDQVNDDERDSEAADDDNNYDDDNNEGREETTDDEFPANDDETTRDENDTDSTEYDDDE